MAMHQPIVITIMVMVILLAIRGVVPAAIHCRFRNGRTRAGRRGSDGREKIPAMSGRTIGGEIWGTADIHHSLSKGCVQRQ